MSECLDILERGNANNCRFFLRLFLTELKKKTENNRKRNCVTIYFCLFVIVKENQKKISYSARFRMM